MPRALIFDKNGNPEEVLALKEMPPEDMGIGQVRVKMRAAAVHPSDFGQIAGTYGKSRVLPAVAGREGVGEVIGLSAGVKNLALGEFVRLPEDAGAWRDEIICDAKPLYRLPGKLSPQQLSLSFINPPTAWRILHDFVWLKRGDSVVTNAGKSAVSEALIKIGAMMGLRVYAVVRNKSAEDEAVLSHWGAAGVFDEADEYFKQIKAALALNQIGGESVLRLIKALRDGGTCVTIGGALREPVRYPTRELIFNDVRLRGFWMDKWMASHPAWRVRVMMNTIWGLMLRGVLTQTVAGEFPLEEYRRALGAALAPGRLGKVLFVGD